MYVIGTSGHIDHGKTSLIKQLSGVDCDRLPEEKSREMTIDIGFASVKYPKFGTVSIIDVPGHERFIRNMVVGAWGVDLALLVIAVDDGWMPQTEDHYQVLKLLGVQRIIVVLNKIDLVDSEMIEFVEEEVIEKLSGSLYEKSDMVKVSSKTGEGVDVLKETILANLRKLSKIKNTDKPYLFVDRVFESRGYGTVVTGTLRNGIFHENESVVLLPSRMEAKIKKIESHFEELDESSSSQRTALNISGLSLDNVKRGNIICKKNFFTESKEIIVKLELIKDKKIKNNHGVEILAGTASIKGKLIFIAEENRDQKTLVVRIKFEEPWFFYPGEPFILTSPGGYRILGGGTIIYNQYKSSVKKAVREHLEIFNNYNEEEILQYYISVKKWIPAKEIISKYPHSEKTVQKMINELIEKNIIITRSDVLVEKEYYNNSIKEMGEVINRNVGLNLKEISDLSAIDLELCKIIISDVIKTHSLVEKDGRYFSGDNITIDTLPQIKKKVLSMLHDNGISGIELDKNKDDSMKKEIKELIKLGFVISLDGNIVYHKDIYDDLTVRIMKLFDEKDKITVPEAKEVSGLSRKFILPLLNRIEGDGLIKRLGDFRIKA